MKFSYLLLAALALAPLALADGLPDLGDYSQTVLPPQEERRIGEEIMREIRASGEMVSDVEVADYIGALGYRLASNSSENTRSFSFFVIQDPTINAFALPGGFIGVHTGLIAQTRSESELASVLAHEIGHVVQHHMSRMLEAQKRATIPSMAALAASILVARANPQLAQAGIVASQAGGIQRQLDYTREHEREADRVGLQILNDSGFDTSAMPTFFETLMKNTRISEGSAPSFLRTHPLTTERIAEIRNRVEQLPYRQVPDSLEFQMVRAKLSAGVGTPSDAVRYFDSNLREKKFSNEASQRYGLVVALLRKQDTLRAEHEFAALQALLPRHPMVETLGANLLMAEGKAKEALARYRNGLGWFPKYRGLVYGYAEALLSTGQLDQAANFLSEKESLLPEDGYLYELQSQAYVRQGKNLLGHQAQGEAYFRNFDIGSAVEQMELAVKSGDGDFYQQSIVEARLKELRQLQGDPKKK
ncbi:peptidase M48 [Novimethylophilus kurashikiensis]|uniref:Peptidase M48 n=1 Tax=Novimethylophilus kurashikiensis TaxID=1825523 RepID=A0A2R5FAD4_9PROT|nr:M48 family metalloprotease [Novimethylophilus kurashikiensis]GBG13651.1 peptidase M48 [Novimethylophilus kurashikiensis]